MKKVKIILFSLLLVLIWSSSIAQVCTHTIRLTDTFGDGWNGGTVDVTVNGLPVLTALTMLGGSGPDDYTFNAATGDVINVTRILDGSYPSEMMIEVFNSASTVIIALQQPPLSPGVNGIGNCPVPPNDPCTANTIIVGCAGAKITADNTGLTNSGTPAPACGSYAGGDAWFSLVVPASGELQIETYSMGLTDVAMAVYSTSGGCSGTLTEIACDDNSGFGNMPKVLLSGQTVGSTLYIRVWDNNNNQTGTFQIDAADLVNNYCVTGNSTDEGGGCAILTTATNGQLGSIWDADNKLDFTSDWTYDFIVNLGANDAGADGLCFVIQNDPSGLSTTGGSGNTLGAGGITNSLIVEIDTYINLEDRNDGLPTVLCSGGPSDIDHIDIWLNGNVNPNDGWCPAVGTRYVPNAVQLLDAGVNYNIENGLDHKLRISYVASSATLTATVLNLGLSKTYGSISYSPIDPMVLFGTNAPYFGFTASTGGINNLQTACLDAPLVLPIVLTSFSADCDNEDVQLEWITASEMNNDYFLLEKSYDAIDFFEIAKVSGAGNSNTTINYNWTDYDASNSTLYYRLKQVDYNGDFEYFNIISVSCKENTAVSIYPNPTNNSITIEGSKYELEEIEIYTMIGQNITASLYISNNGDVVSIDLSALAQGVYTVRTRTTAHKVYKY
jgi:Bacterial lectin/Secretion system C-terminal sorting domain